MANITFLDGISKNEAQAIGNEEVSIDQLREGLKAELDQIANKTERAEKKKVLEDAFKKIIKDFERTQAGIKEKVRYEKRDLDKDEKREARELIRELEKTIEALRDSESMSTEVFTFFDNLNITTEGEVTISDIPLDGRTRTYTLQGGAANPFGSPLENPNAPSLTAPGFTNAEFAYLKERGFLDENGKIKEGKAANYQELREVGLRGFEAKEAPKQVINLRPPAGVTIEPVSYDATNGVWTIKYVQTENGERKESTIVLEHVENVKIVLSGGLDRPALEGLHVNLQKQIHWMSDEKSIFENLNPNQSAETSATADEKLRYFGAYEAIKAAAEANAFEGIPLLSTPMNTDETLKVRIQTYLKDLFAQLAENPTKIHEAWNKILRELETASPEGRRIILAGIITQVALHAPDQFKTIFNRVASQLENILLFKPNENPTANATEINAIILLLKTHALEDATVWEKYFSKDGKTAAITPIGADPEAILAKYETLVRGFATGIPAQVTTARANEKAFVALKTTPPTHNPEFASPRDEFMNKMLSTTTTTLDDYSADNISDDTSEEDWNQFLGRLGGLFNEDGSFKEDLWGSLFYEARNDGEIDANDRDDLVATLIIFIEEKLELSDNFKKAFFSKLNLDTGIGYFNNSNDTGSNGLTRAINILNKYKS